MTAQACTKPPAWSEISAALLTPTIALLGAYIAWQQWQTNRNKLKLDLFEKRSGVYNAAVELINSILGGGRVTTELRYRSLDKTRSANFVVGEKIMNYLDNEIHRRAVLLETLQAELDALVVGPERINNVGQQRDLKEWFAQQYEVLKSLFEKQLNLRH